jgi:hypothetical protein
LVDYIFNFLINSKQTMSIPGSDMFTLASYCYTDFDGYKRNIFVREKDWCVMGGKVEYFITGPGQYYDASSIHDFTPGYVEQLSVEERRNRFESVDHRWSGAGHILGNGNDHTHTRVFDLEKREFRTLIRKNIGLIIRREFSRDTNLFDALLEFSEEIAPLNGERNPRPPRLIDPSSSSGLLASQLWRNWTT